MNWNSLLTSYDIKIVWLCNMLLLSLFTSLIIKHTAAFKIILWRNLIEEKWVQPTRLDRADRTISLTSACDFLTSKLDCKYGKILSFSTSCIYDTFEFTKTLQYNIYGCKWIQRAPDSSAYAAVIDGSWTLSPNIGNVSKTSLVKLGVLERNGFEISCVYQGEFKNGVWDASIDYLSH